MGRNYGLPTMGVWATYMGLTNLRVTVGQAEETDWKRYKPAFVLSSYVLLLLLHTTAAAKGMEAIPDHMHTSSRVFR